MGVQFAVNGKTIDFELADHTTPLLWALRDDLGDPSPKYGCGVGQCGSCRVLVDGVSTTSCTTTLGDVDGHDVTTLQGLADDSGARSVADALLAHNAGQCGYCLPGIAITLTALVQRGAPVNDHQLRRALDDHLCRCGAQPRILRAAREALGTLYE